MSPLPEINHSITKEEADKLKEAFRELHKDEEGTIFAHSFHSNQVKELVEAKDMEVFSIFKGYDAENSKEVVILEGRNSAGEDVGIYLEMSQPCPPLCP